MLWPQHLYNSESPNEQLRSFFKYLTQDLLLSSTSDTYLYYAMESNVRFAFIPLLRHLLAICNGKHAIQYPKELSTDYQVFLISDRV